MLKYLWILWCQSYLLQYIKPTSQSIFIGLGHDKKIKQQSMLFKRVQVDLFCLHTGRVHYYAILFYSDTILFLIVEMSQVCSMIQTDRKDRRMECHNLHDTGWAKVFIYSQWIGDTLIQGVKSFLSLPQTRLKNKTLLNHSSSSPTSAHHHNHTGIERHNKSRCI